MTSGGEAPFRADSELSRGLPPRTFCSCGGELVSLGLRTQAAVISYLTSEQRLLEIVLQLQGMESRMARALMRRPGGSGQVMRQIERERQRVGHQLHTGVGQLLASIPIQSAIIRRKDPSLSAATREALQRIDSLAHQAHEEVRGISKLLYAPEWQRLPIHAALNHLWESSGVSERFIASINVSPLPFEPEAAVRTLLYRAAQEGISNIVRHAQATRVDIALTSADGSVELTVNDDGVGFDAARLLEGSANPGGGIGLRALRDDAAELGGRFTISSGPRGTTLRLILPSEQGKAERRSHALRRGFAVSSVA